MKNAEEVVPSLAEEGRSTQSLKFWDFPKSLREDFLAANNNWPASEGISGAAETH